MSPVERGRLIVVSAPSGAGKTTLVHEIIRRRPETRFSISYTTRPPRESEQNGKDYFFVGEVEFETMRATDAFLESARVVAVHEIPRPEPAHGEVLIRIRSVGVCASDIHYYEHGRIGRYVVDAPLILGHEHHVITQVVSPCLAKHAYTTWDPRFDRNPITHRQSSDTLAQFDNLTRRFVAKN